MAVLVHRIALAAVAVLAAASAFLHGPLPAQAAGGDTVIFGGLDLGASRYASAGFKRGIFGTPVDRTGFVAMGTLGMGSYPRTGAGSGHGAGTLGEASLLVGYQSAREALTWGAYIGPEIGRHWHQPQTFRQRDDTRIGIRALLDLWMEPRQDMLVQATLAGGTAESHVYARFAVGWRIFGFAHLGPEAAAYAKPGYREAKLGLHLSQIALGPAMLRLSGGWQWTDNGKPESGPYVSLAAYMPL